MGNPIKIISTIVLIHIAVFWIGMVYIATNYHPFAAKFHKWVGFSTCLWVVVLLVVIVFQ